MKSVFFSILIVLLMSCGYAQDTIPKWENREYPPKGTTRQQLGNGESFKRHVNGRGTVTFVTRNANGQLLRRTRVRPYCSHPKCRKSVVITRNEAGKRLTKTRSKFKHSSELKEHVKTYSRAQVQPTEVQSSNE